MTYAMGMSDSVATLQAALDAAAAKGAVFTLPGGGYRLAGTGLGYGNNARIVLVGDLYNDHGPQVGTLYCLTNRSHGRLSNLAISGRGGAFVGSSSPPNGATRKGLGIVDTDGFVITDVRTRGPLTGFGLEVKNATNGSLQRLQLMSGANVPGADGLHFFGACSKITGAGIQISSGDDAVSFTCENGESLNATMRGISLSGLALNSAAFSCIKLFTSKTTGRARISGIRLAHIKGRITQGPTGCPLMMQNTGFAQGCVIEDIAIDDADLDFGAATLDGPTAYLTDINNVRLTNMRLRGRRNGQFFRAVRCRGLVLRGEAWETIPGSSASDMVQLERCGDYIVDLVVRSATGARLGSIRASRIGTDQETRYLGISGA